MATQLKEIYLTFDDGPVPGPTDFVLDTLKQYDAKATFFCIGDNIQKHPDVFRNIVDNGHAIGNHTFNHVNGWRTSSEMYRENVTRCNDIINSMTERPNPLNLFRPPYGRITRQQINMLDNYKIIMWDVLSIDYDKALRPEKCLARTIHAARPGSIVVFHDSHKAQHNLMYVLPRFIDHYSSRGFIFKAIQD